MGSDFKRTDHVVGGTKIYGTTIFFKQEKTENQGRKATYNKAAENEI